ncbi:CLUMA_CG015907, isoform A, partial [Clunio marinus]
MMRIQKVFHFHIILGLQNLLRVWLHAAGIFDSHRCHNMCDNCLHIFPSQCRRLSMAMDFVPIRMYGLFQTVFYFGYMALFSGALGIICGTVGYVGTTYFVRKIYSN